MDVLICIKHICFCNNGLNYIHWHILLVLLWIILQANYFFCKKQQITHNHYYLHIFYNGLFLHHKQSLQ